MMTKAWFLLVSLSLMLIYLGLVCRNSSLLALAFPYLLFSLGPFWRKMLRPNLKVQREFENVFLPDGQTCRIKISLTNGGEALDEIKVVDLVPRRAQLEGICEYFGPLRPGQTISLDYSIHGLRGKYEFSGLFVSVGDLWGLRRREDFYPAPGTLTFFPQTENLQKIMISPRRTRIFTGLIKSRESGTGVEFWGTRAYVPGDSLRHLNWKAVGRWDFLITNLFEQERIADVGIILDARRIGEVRRGKESLFEHAVRAAASLAKYFLEEGNRVGLLVYGNYIAWTYPAVGKQHYARIMAALAEAELGDHAVFKEFQNIPTRLFPPGSPLVIISPLHYKDIFPLRYLRALDYQILIISPNPVAFEESLLPHDQFRHTAARIANGERNMIISRLRRSGLKVVDWNVQQPLRLALRTLGEKGRCLSG